MNDVVALVPNWMVARHALGAVRSLRKYYPEMPIFIVDDKVDKKHYNKWRRQYAGDHYNKEEIFDPDSEKLIGLYKTAYLLKEHQGKVAGEGHGYALEYAMKFIHSKWVFHLSTDTRIVKKGFIEYLLENVDEKCCGIGRTRRTHAGYPSLHKAACMWRGDLYHKYNLNFEADLKKGYDAGSRYFKDLLEKGYHLKKMNLGKDWIVHLRYSKDTKKEWKELY